MISPLDDSGRLVERVRDAYERRRELRIEGANSKQFLTARSDGEVLSTLSHSGVIDYLPQELVISVRSGTPLSHLREVLESGNQILAGDPPSFQRSGTVGGAIACGLSGPGRPWLGALRDCVLGIEMINGMGQHLRFGGRVMKNVAGYDISRLMTGSLGTLGVILTANLKLLPQPRKYSSWRCECTLARSVQAIHALERTGAGVTATAHLDGALHVRVFGPEDGVQSDTAMSWTRFDDTGFWESIRDHSHPFFSSSQDLWKHALPKGGHPDVFERAHESLAEWAGARLWSPEPLVDAVPGTDGSVAEQFRTTLRMPHLSEGLGRQIKQAFDPAWILNPVTVGGQSSC